MSQNLAVAYRKQIRNEITKLFAQTGKPRTRRAAAGRKWGNQRTAGPKTKQNEGPGLGSIPAIGQTTSWVCKPFRPHAIHLLFWGFSALNLNLESESGGFSA